MLNYFSFVDAVHLYMTEKLVLYRVVDLVKEGSTVILRNARVDMYKGSMRLVVDKWGLIEVTEPATFTVRDDCNMSLIEFERIDVVV